MLNYVLRSLRGSNLEVFKFGLYLMFPIGWMYYFGTNLEERFSVPDFWPTQAQGHKIPYEKEEIKAEVERIRNQIKQNELARRRKQETERQLEEAKMAFRRPNGDDAVVEIENGVTASR